MIFDKECKVMVSTLNETEATDFVEFLKAEIDRHKYAILVAELKIIGAKHQGRKALAEFYQSAIKRHKMDIDSSMSLCYTIIKRFHLEDMLNGDE